MSKFFKLSMLASGLLVGLLGMSSQAFAHLPPGGVVLEFEADTTTGNPMPAAVFPGFGQFYLEDGVEHSAIGFGTAPGNSIGVASGGSSHLHGSSTDGTGGTIASNTSFLEPDSGGGFFQLADGDPFSMLGMDVASLDLSLVGSGFSTLTMRGYTSADLSTSFDVVVGDDGAGNPIDFVGGVFDTETGAAFNGTHLHLDEVAEFGEIYLFEYFFDGPGRGNDPGSTPAFANLGFMIDNVELGDVAVVPVPAAVYLFGSAMIGLIGIGKRRGNTVVAA